MDDFAMRKPRALVSRERFSHRVTNHRRHGLLALNWSLAEGVLRVDIAPVHLNRSLVMCALLACLIGGGCRVSSSTFSSSACVAEESVPSVTTSVDSSHTLPAHPSPTAAQAARRLPIPQSGPEESPSQSDECERVADSDDGPTMQPVSLSAEQSFLEIVEEDDEAETDDSAVSTEKQAPDATAAPLPATPSTNDALAVPDSSQQDESSAAGDQAPQYLEELPFVEPNESGPPLLLPRVIESVFNSYPLLEVAFQERQIAAGQQLSAWGEFDLDLKASSVAAPMGYYKNYRHGISLTQPMMTGGYLYGGYKLGRGEFQPWYKERQTNEGGEFSVGVGTPLLKNRAIDKRRGELMRSGLARQAVEPDVRAQLLQFVRSASYVYWSWVAAGKAVQAERDLLRLARQRVEQVRLRVEAGDLERVAEVNNRQLIAARETKVIAAERKLQAAAIKLSLFLRDGEGRPLVASDGILPREFPPHRPPNLEQLSRDIQSAIEYRPEIQALDLEIQSATVQLAEAENSLLPKLDAGVQASQDTGIPVDAKRDKSPFELEAGFYGEVPLQRRAARGKVRSVQGKLGQLRAKRRFLGDKITAEVRDAVSALQAAAGRIDRAATSLDLARETLSLGRQRFNAGDIDLVDLNLFEKAVNDAQLSWISAQEAYFQAQADYRAALAIDPMQVFGQIE
jgi:outer membrane protein TolC